MKDVLLISNMCVQRTVKQIPDVLAMSSSALEVLGRSVNLSFCILTLKHINSVIKTKTGFSFSSL